MNIFKRVHLIESPYEFSLGDKVRVYPHGCVGIVSERKVVISWFPKIKYCKAYRVVSNRDIEIVKEGHLESVGVNVFDKQREVLSKHADTFKRAGSDVSDVVNSLSSLRPKNKGLDIIKTFLENKIIDLERSLTNANETEQSYLRNFINAYTIVLNEINDLKNKQ